MIQIEKADNKFMLKEFIDFPHKLYQNDVNYVPELFIAQRDMLTPGKHPFHKHSTLQPFLALDHGKVVGRIAAILNRNHNDFNNAQDGFFGFFDTTENPEVADRLLDAAQKWLKENGAKTAIGPVNFSTNETCGMLIEGYDMPPVAMMTYNKPYYNKFVDDAGFKKKTDLIAWQITSDDYDDKPLRMTNLLRERLQQKGITIRKANMKNFKQEVENLQDIYNKAWDKNLGFVPMTKEEFEYMAKDMKLILDPDFCLVAEHNGKAIGFALCIPDINQVLIKIKNGRLLPTGIFKLLFGKGKINALRVIALGVLEPYRKMGIEAVFYGDIIQKCLEKNINTVEASWILEDNFLMNKAIENIKGKPYKKYRIYEKEI
ncbi:hypothetical protein ACTHGU_03365 [Chitinophagaceae bacterium MMS25-I14]